MATFEQCETQSSGLSNISKTLNLFDTFKPSQEEEKDSDEESFHLPMLDCDDDLESNSGKESSTSVIDKETHCGESEDDILNKFETNGTPDIDPKIEDIILDEIDNILEKTEEVTDTTIKDVQSDNTCKDSSVETEVVSKNNTDDNSCTENYVSDTPAMTDISIQSELDENTTNEEKISTDEKEDVDIIENEKEALEDNTASNNDADIVNEKEEGNKKPENGDIEENKLKNDEETNLGSNSIEVIDGIGDINSTNDTKEHISHTSKLISINEEEYTKDFIENNESTSELNKTDTDFLKLNSELTIDNDLKTDSIEEPLEVDSNEKKEDTKEDNLEGNDSASNNISAEIDPNECTVTKAIENADRNEDSSNNITENELISELAGPTIESMEFEETIPNTDVCDIHKNNEPDKCENSNDSSKSQNLDSDDLLDISVIRDADEDNASAIEENANDAHISEKSDNDNDDQDEGSDKAENELDENEMDQDDNLLTNDKDDNMEFEDGGSSLCDQNIISENTSDSDSKSNEKREIKDSENDSTDITTLIKEKFDNIESNKEKREAEEQNLEVKDTNSCDTITSENQENVIKSSKRSLSEADIDSPNKKIKLIEWSKTGTVTNHNYDKINTLISFVKYMHNKNLENNLTRSDLEQFALQKICEVILHKTNVGEAHQIIKKQEQMIENLRKDVQQLTKQARDLDIVNKKLMSELRIQNGTKKPLVPLKITRSVGLQVKLNSSMEANNNRRKTPAPATPRTPNNNNNNNSPARSRIIPAGNAPVVRQVATSPRKPPTPTAPLLSQALQSRQVTPANTAIKRPPIRPKPAEPQKPPNTSVIDLTDEDDKASKAMGNSMKIINKTIPLGQGKTINIIPAKTVATKTLNSNQNKTVAVGQVKTTNISKVGTPTRTVTTLPQGVRLTPSQVKGGSITIPASVVTSNSGTTQFMYVVQPGPVVTTTAGGTQKAVLLNFQPTNGVLTSTINGSSVSVLPSKTTNTVQLKTVTALRKHPAPLPSPPLVTTNSSLKPLLPKPHLSIRKTDTGIILQWRMPYNLDLYEAIASYQLFAYQETSALPNTDMWRKVGDVKALALPMACTLTQFADKNKYYFAVRSVDIHKRIGAFSEPEEISL